MLTYALIKIKIKYKIIVFYTLIIITIKYNIEIQSVKNLVKNNIELLTVNKNNLI